MRFRNRRVKQNNPDMKLAIGSMQEIAKTNDGKAVIVDGLHFLPELFSNNITVDRLEHEVMVTLFEMCLRKAMAIRDPMGNVEDDFYGWSYVQYKAVSLLSSEVVEDFTNKIWYGVEKMLDNVFCHMPYYALREIHYSVLTREIVFAGDYGSALTPYVQFVNYDTDGRPDSIVHRAMQSVGNAW